VARANTIEALVVTASPSIVHAVDTGDHQNSAGSPHCVVSIA
jgi:hypothetical protein